MYPEGANQTQITEPKPGADLLDVKVDKNSKGAAPSWTFTNISSDHDIKSIGTPTPGQVHVFFNATPRSGEMPLLVNFTDHSLGLPTSWYWQFGDGTNSTVQNPSHIYTTPGVYSVTLRCTNNQTGGYGVWNHFITGTNSASSQPPLTRKEAEITPSFTFSPQNGTVPLTVQFNDQSTGNPSSWIWSFGDGSSSTLQNPTHQYTTAGTFSVTLDVQNSMSRGSVKKPNAIQVI